MQLIIDTYGISLRIDNNRLLVEKDGTCKSVHPSRLTAIHIFMPCTLTSPVAIWAIEHGIPLLFYNRKGQVAARIWEPHFGSQAAVRLAQMDYCQSPEALFMIKDWLLAKAMGQRALHQKWGKTDPHQKIMAKMDGLIGRLQAETGLNLPWLRRLEAHISRWHWTGVAIGLRRHVAVGPRNLRPAKDRFNALLNYLYGTLYGLVEGCQIAAGLDPHISIMHRMDYNTPSLVFDMIEPFRPWADEFAIDLFLLGKWQQSFTVETGDAILLTPAGKKFILAEWFAWLEQKTPAPKKKIKRRDQVQQLCSALAADLLKKYNETKNTKGL